MKRKLEDNYKQLKDSLTRYLPSPCIFEISKVLEPRPFLLIMKQKGQSFQRYCSETSTLVAEDFPLKVPKDYIHNTHGDLELVSLKDRGLILCDDMDAQNINLFDGEKVMTRSHFGYVSQVSWDLESQTLVYSSLSSINLWNIDTNKVEHSLYQEEDCWTWELLGNSLLSAVVGEEEGRRVDIWNLQSRQRVKFIPIIFDEDYKMVVQIAEYPFKVLLISIRGQGSDLVHPLTGETLCKHWVDVDEYDTIRSIEKTLVYRNRIYPNVSSAIPLLDQQKTSIEWCSERFYVDVILPGVYHQFYAFGPDTILFIKGREQEEDDDYKIVRIINLKTGEIKDVGLIGEGECHGVGYL